VSPVRKRTSDGKVEKLKGLSFRPFLPGTNDINIIVKNLGKNLVKVVFSA
jgi:hypothetical protein